MREAAQGAEAWQWKAAAGCFVIRIMIFDN